MIKVAAAGGLSTEQHRQRCWPSALPTIPEGDFFVGGSITELEAGTFCAERHLRSAWSSIPRPMSGDEKLAMLDDVYNRELLTPVTTGP